MEILSGTMVATIDPVQFHLETLFTVTMSIMVASRNKSSLGADLRNFSTTDCNIALTPEGGENQKS
jgi:hypothetical protein